MQNNQINFKDLPIESLINYISVYRVFKINKKIATQCMIELDSRKEMNYDQYESLISNFSSVLKNIGKGYVVKYHSDYSSNEIIKVLKELKLNAFLISKSLYYIHIGSPSETELEKIKSIPGILDIIQDKKVLENVISTKIP